MIMIEKLEIAMIAEKCTDSCSKCQFGEICPLCGHMDLSRACCACFNQARLSDRAGEQKRVTICHMPPGHKLSSRHTLGCVRSGGSAAAASLQQVPSCPMLSPLSPDTQMSPSPPPNLNYDPPIWMDGCTRRALVTPGN